MLTAFLHLILGRDNAPLLPLLDAFTGDDLLARLPAIDVPTVVVCEHRSSGRCCRAFEVR